MTEAAHPIAVANPQVSERSKELLAGAIERGQLAQGPLVAELEQLCATMADAEHAVGVSSGTDALELAYEAVGLGPGDELITTPFTFGATVNAAIRLGVTVRFADIGADYTIDPASVAAQITPNTKAIVPVHLFGLPADMAALQTVIADRPDITLIEDAAQAHGASIGERRVGTEEVGCFSFYATKNVFAGEGGVITTNNAEIADRCRLLRNQGMGGGGYNYVVVGRNSRMSDLHAAIAIPQLEQLDGITAGRTEMAEAYGKLLVGNDLGISLPVIPEGRTSAWHQYTVVLPDTVDRAKVVDHLRAEKIFPGIYYPESLNDVALYRDHKLVEAGETPVTRRIAAGCLSLPAHHNLVPSDAERVVEVLSAALADPGTRAQA
jgi:dTDP-4-amino-4,6-dideoxygalactose transaminase